MKTRARNTSCSDSFVPIKETLIHLYIFVPKRTNIKLAFLSNVTYKTLFDILSRRWNSGSKSQIMNLSFSTPYVHPHNHSYLIAGMRSAETPGCIDQDPTRFLLD